MSYTINYDPRTGQPTGILRSDGASIPLDPRNADFAAFLAWNAQQPVPLDYTTPHVSLPAVQQQAVAALMAQADAFVAQSYNPNTLQLLNGLYSQAVLKGLANRAAYLDPIIEWGNAVAAALEAAIEQVEVATTADAVAAVTLSLPAPPSPLPTRAGAMAITN